jgi:hypothetical protein
MIKAFAPLLGEFQGGGRLADGTEVIGILETREALEDVAYAFRAHLSDESSGTCLLDAFLVLSNTPSNGMELHFFDTREPLHKLTWTGGGEGQRDIARHHFIFEGQRAKGARVRLSFDVTSAEKCRVRFESMGKRGEWREHWAVGLERRHQVGLRAA